MRSHKVCVYFSNISKCPLTTAEVTLKLSDYRMASSGRYKSTLYVDFLGLPNGANLIAIAGELLAI